MSITKWNQNFRKSVMRILVKLLPLLACIIPLEMAWAANITAINFSALTGDRTEVRLTFDGQPPEPTSYAIESPARISIDFAETGSDVAKYFPIGAGNARSATLVSAGNRTRLVLNLTNIVPYSMVSAGNTVILLIGEAYGNEMQALASSVPTPVATSAPAAVVPQSNDIESIDFRRGVNGEGQVVVTFSNASANADIQEMGGKISVRIPGFNLPKRLQRRFNVVDFATAVDAIDVYKEGQDTVMSIEPNGFHEYLAYQTDKTLTIDVKAITEEEQEKQRTEKFPYNGEKLSLNFQDIQVRSVLQLIADFTGLNLVASDSIAGSITLRLKNVPWDQALDLVLKTKGLGQRQNGNVLLVAPAEELAAREKLELESKTQLEKLAPLTTEFIQINYAKAADIVAILQAQSGGAAASADAAQASDQSSGLVSNRGKLAVDERTNTIMVRDTVSNLEKIRQAIAIFDVPVRQVLIEARVVVARSQVGTDLGIRWGVSGAPGDTRFSGSLESNTAIGNVLGANVATNITYPDALAVNLPVNNTAASSLAVGFTALDYVLDLELSAMESNGNAEIVSQPKILTADGRTARILSGTEIPFTNASGETSFRNALLSLEVTPQITPDGRLVLDLEVTQDSVGDIIGGNVSINKNQLSTQVLVNNGQTIVLGGVFQSQDVERIDKTPFLGDLPYIGKLFSRTTTSTEKNELLIFITPKLVEELLAGS
jgi:type IV pilus assembly protein PilQ